jgi:hypothetical protein
LPFDAEIAVKFNAGGTRDEADAAKAEDVGDWALAVVVLGESTSAVSAEKMWIWNFMVVVE